MNTKYDGEWITKDLNDSIVLNLLNDKDQLYSSYEAIDLINVVGDDIRIGIANVNDLNNLLLYGVMRFRSLKNIKEYVDIPVRNLYMLYENPNVMKLLSSELKFPNIKKSIEKMDAFVVINGEKVDVDKYAFITTLINEPSTELKKILEISRDYGNMDMNEKYIALTNVDILNHVKEKK